MAANPKYTEQPYVGSEGKVLLADRAYVAAINTVIPTTKQSGATPAGYTDLGAIEGSVVTLDKADPTLTDVTTGLFEILRDQVAVKDGDTVGTFTLVEVEPSIWAAITGDALVAIGAGTSIFIGGRPIIQKAVLFIGQNPTTGSEFHHYNPKSNLTYKMIDVNRFSGIQITARFMKFTDAADAAGLSRDFRYCKY